jgi:hypothetical protein
MEKYVKIIGFENYEVSDLGNIRNIKTGRILKPIKSKRGYYQLGLYKNNDKKYYSQKVHRIVAMMHLENIENLTDVDHKDRNRLNNAASNLRWVSKKVNLENSLFGKNPYLTINDISGKYCVYYPLTRQYFECITIDDAVLKFLSLQ